MFVPPSVFFSLSQSPTSQSSSKGYRSCILPFPPVSLRPPQLVAYFRPSAANAGRQIWLMWLLSVCRWYSCMLGKKCSLAPLKEELRKQGVSSPEDSDSTNTSAICIPRQSVCITKQPPVLISVCSCCSTHPSVQCLIPGCPSNS